MQFIRKSMLSGVVRTRDIDVTEEEYDRWRSGVLIQRAMPHLSDDDREFLISGVTPEEWEAFNEEADHGGYEDEVEDDYEYLTPREKETNDRLDMGRNDAGEYLGYM